jgi:hypothetical protein
LHRREDCHALLHRSKLEPAARPRQTNCPDAF